MKDGRQLFALIQSCACYNTFMRHSHTVYNSLFSDIRRLHSRALSLTHLLTRHVYSLYYTNKKTTMKTTQQKKNMKNPKKAKLKDDDLKNELITGLLKTLTTFAKTRNIEINTDTLSDADVVEFERGSDDADFICKAKLNCPFCSKSFSLHYKNFWSTSHASAHLKQHLN